jgi:hypothetical protein
LSRCQDRDYCDELRFVPNTHHISKTEAEMAQTAIILIRVLLGLALALVGLMVFGQGLAMIAHVDFPTWGLILAMLVGMGAGSGLLFGAWKLLSTTLRMPEQPAH